MTKLRSCYLRIAIAPIFLILLTANSGCGPLKNSSQNMMNESSSRPAQSQVIPRDQWWIYPQPVHNYIYTSEPATLLGSGLKPYFSGRLLKQCFSTFDQISDAARYDISLTFISNPVEELILTKNNKIKEILKDALSHKLQPQSPEPLLLVVTTLFPDRQRWIQPGTEVLHEDAHALLAQGNLWGFFEVCGTEYISHVRSSTEPMLVVTIYPESLQQRKELTQTISQEINTSTDDLTQLRILNHLPAELPLAVMISATTENPAPVNGYSFLQENTRDVAHQIASLLANGNNGGIETNIRYNSTPWLDLPEVRNALSSEREISKLAGEYAFLKTIEYRLIDFLAAKKISDQESGSVGESARACEEALGTLVPALNWPQYELCRDSLWRRSEGDFLNSDECRPIYAGFKAFDDSLQCSAFLQRARDMQSSFFVNRSPLVMILRDESQVLPEIVPGTQIDGYGRILGKSCQEEESSLGQDVEAAPVSAHNLGEQEVWSDNEWDDRYRKGTQPFISVFPSLLPLPPIAIDQKIKLKKLEKEWSGLQLTQRAQDGSLTVIPIRKMGNKPSMRITINAEEGEDGGAKSSGKHLDTLETKPSSVSGTEEVLPLIKNSRKAKITEVVTGFHPIGFRDWSTLRKIGHRLLNGWQQGPKLRVIYEGEQTLIGLTHLDAKSIRLTSAASELAQKDLAAFTKECGTHIVSQVKYSKGIRTYFTRNSPGDLEVSLIPFGVAKTQKELAEDLGEITFSSLCQATITTFHELLRDDQQKVVPLLLELTPWSEYLTSQRLIEGSNIKP